MNADDITKAWRRHYPSCPPSAYFGLYKDKNVGYVRFHYLPDTGWYENHPQDTYRVLRRMTALCGQALGTGLSIAIRKEQKHTHPLPDLSEYPLPELAHPHLFEPREIAIRGNWFENPIYPNRGNEIVSTYLGAEFRWTTAWFAKLLDLYSRDRGINPGHDWYSVEPDILFLNPRTGMVVSPYHSGVNIFSPKPEGVLNIERRFRRWLPPPLPQRKGQVTMEFLSEGTPADQAAFIEDIRQSLAAETKTSD